MILIFKVTDDLMLPSWTIEIKIFLELNFVKYKGLCSIKIYLLNHKKWYRVNNGFLGFA